MGSSHTFSPILVPAGESALAWGTKEPAGGPCCDAVRVGQLTISGGISLGRSDEPRELPVIENAPRLGRCIAA